MAYLGKFRGNVVVDATSLEVNVKRAETFEAMVAEAVMVEDEVEVQA